MSMQVRTRNRQIPCSREVSMMRILLGYNGSDASVAALADLRDAGLPATTQVLVLSVAELWVEPRSTTNALEAATEAKEVLNKDFPEWSVYAETASGSPAREILARAETFKPDMIVVGEPRQQIKDRNVLLGQTSQKILAEAECPVRIARGRSSVGSRAKRIIVGFDGSAGAIKAVESIAAKSWQSAPKVCLLAVADVGVPTTRDRLATRNEAATVDLSSVSHGFETFASKAVARLAEAGISAAVETRLGHAKNVIVEEAEKWDADAIFVGPHGSANSFDRFILGSVSAAVAARAPCSVEVVRPANY